MYCETSKHKTIRINKKKIATFVSSPIGYIPRISFFASFPSSSLRFPPIFSLISPLFLPCFSSSAPLSFFLFLDLSACFSYAFSSSSLLLLCFFFSSFFFCFTFLHLLRFPSSFSWIYPPASLLLLFRFLFFSAASPLSTSFAFLPSISFSKSPEKSFPFFFFSTPNHDCPFAFSLPPNPGCPPTSKRQ